MVYGGVEWELLPEMGVRVDVLLLELLKQMGVSVDVVLLAWMGVGVDVVLQKLSAQMGAGGDGGFEEGEALFSVPSQGLPDGGAMVGVVPEEVGMTPVASRMMRRMMMSTITIITTMSFTFFHQYDRATFWEVCLKF